MPEPDGYCTLKAPEEARNEARRVKRERGEDWGQFLKAAAEALRDD